MAMSRLLLVRSFSYTWNPVNCFSYAVKLIDLERQLVGSSRKSSFWPELIAAVFFISSPILSFENLPIRNIQIPAYLNGASLFVFFSWRLSSRPLLSCCIMFENLGWLSLWTWAPYFSFCISVIIMTWISDTHPLAPGPKSAFASFSRRKRLAFLSIVCW